MEESRDESTVEEQGAKTGASGSMRTAQVTALRLVGAAVLTYAFMLVLITASLQASTGDRLSGLQPARDFSVGHADWREWQSTQREISALQQRERQLMDAIKAAENDAEAAQGQVYSGTAGIAALRRRFRTVPGCEMLGEDPESLDLEAQLADLRTCSDGAPLGPARSEEIQAAIGVAQEIRSAQMVLRRNRAAADRLRDELGRVQAAIVAREAIREDLRPVRKSFAELEEFRTGPLVGAGLIGQLPPSVVQILLAFLSGMFGALLVTLVLIVYPRSNLSLTSSSGGYGARILLGGLISIGVFVVLGGGTAVLGTSQAVGEGEANYLAFCAIGILAGMFSDRVAHWLSSRADTLFGRTQTPRRAAAAARNAGRRRPI